MTRPLTRFGWTSQDDARAAQIRAEWGEAEEVARHREDLRNAAALAREVWASRGITVHPGFAARLRAAEEPPCEG
ncbi:hypothetical protein SAMN02799642_02821 [Methylobacterium brachiatum]|nr:hypothetical protein SAMN02799642_02821 [Methylobacterium brachiatum]